MWIRKAGYSLRDLTEKELDRKGMLDGLAGVTAVDHLQAQVRGALAAQGTAYRLMHKGRMVGCLVFERADMQAADLISAHPETEGQLTGVREDGSITVLRMTVRVAAPEHEAGLEGLEHYRGLVLETGYLLAMEKLTAMLWNDVCWLPSGRSSFSAAGYVGGMAVGIAVGTAMGQVSLGVCFGACFAMLFGLALPAAAGKKKE